MAAIPRESPKDEVLGNSLGMGNKLGERSDSLLVGGWVVRFPRSGISTARGELTPKAGGKIKQSV